MSWPALKWMLLKRLPAPQKSAGITLARRQPDDLRAFSGAAATLADESGLSLSGFKLAVAALKSKGLLAVTRQSNGANLYDLQLSSASHDVTTHEVTTHEVIGHQSRGDGPASHEVTTNKHNYKHPQINTSAEARGEVIATLLLKPNHGSYDLCADDFERDTATFPNVDISAQYRLMASWCTANPTKRKTTSGVRAFINGWLARSLKDTHVPNRQSSTFTQNRSQQRVDSNLDAYHTAFGDWQAPDPPRGVEADIREPIDFTAILPQALQLQAPGHRERH